MMNETWAKSSRSNPNGECLEARWQTSSHSVGGACLAARWAAASGCASNECLEARQDVVVQVRDSKLGEDSAVLSFSPAAWKAFLGTLGR